MPSRKRQVEIEVVVDDKRATAHLRNIDTQVQKSGKMFSNLGTAVKAGMAAFGAREVLEAFQRMDQMNIKAEAVGRQFDTVFGSMADDAREWADEQNEAFGVGLVNMEAMAANTQDLLVPMGFMREEAFGLTKDILTTANALSEWTGGTIDATDAADRIRKAMLGEREGLIPLNVKILETDINSRLAAEGQDKLTGAALEQAKAQATLEIIIDKSTDALAAYEQRTGTALAEQKELTARTEDAAFTFSDLFRPTIESYKRLMGDAAAVTEVASDGIDTLSGSTGKAKIEVGDLLSPVTMIAAAIELFGGNTEEANAAIERSGPNFARAGRGARDLADDLNEAATAAERLRNAYGIEEPVPTGRFGYTTAPGYSREGPFHEGGRVPGTPGEDVPIMAQAGEWVSRRADAGSSHGGASVINYITQYLTSVTSQAEMNEMRRRGVR